MKKRPHPLILSALVCSILTLFCACTDDNYFGNAPWNEIQEFNVPGQSGSTAIDTEANTVSLSVGNGVDRSDLVPTVFEISNFAKVTPAKTEARDFSGPVEYVVRAENGSERVWTVTIDEVGENPQLLNSDFDLWYEASAGIIGTPILYDEPGESEANTIWATANFGLTNYKAQPNTTPVDLEEDNYAAKMVTVAAPAVVPIAAATLFTGEFNLNIVNPSASAVFGTPFSSRPSGFRVNYAYVPGPDLVEGEDDKCDIYVLLEKRDGDSVARVATGWFRSNTNTGADEWTSLEVELKYGPLSPTDEWYNYANIKGDDTWADPDDTPTHISVVFSSSALGDEYKGSIGSTLVVDDFELLYD